MKRDPATARGSRPRRSMLMAATALAATAALALSGCAGTVDGEATSGLSDPFKAGGLPAEDGPSGPLPDAPPATGTVNDTDNGEIDEIALLSVNDIEEYWEENFDPPLEGSFS